LLTNNTKNFSSKLKMDSEQDKCRIYVKIKKRPILREFKSPYYINHSRLSLQDDLIFLMLIHQHHSMLIHFLLSTSRRLEEKCMLKSMKFPIITSIQFFPPLTSAASIPSPPNNVAWLTYNAKMPFEFH
jgi:hypothetical protein